MAQFNCLVVDDETDIRELVVLTLERMDIRADSASSVAEAKQLLASQTYNLCLTDMRLPDGLGLELVQHISANYIGLPVAVITAYGSAENAVSALKAGAFDYLTKPISLKQLRPLVESALKLSSSDAKQTSNTVDLIGQSPAMDYVRTMITKLARSQAPVYVSGESGSGKELVARALHRHSQRAAHAFVAINTAAIPRDLLESELFGHERGAFTGAQTMRRGRFEQAEGGTLFLDEIGDMPAELQTRLLRVLSDGQFYRVGGHQPIKANVRVITATHQHLEKRVTEGLFREDLFHRLNVIRLRLPSLSERREDIPLLTRHFLTKSAHELKVEAKRISASALTFLATLDWPGNVRQLENVCHWLTVMAPAQTIEVADLPPDLRDNKTTLDGAGAGAAGSAGGAAGGGWIDALEREATRRLAAGESAIGDELTRAFETALIKVALRQTGGRRIEASLLLGMGRNTITRKIAELNIESKE